MTVLCRSWVFLACLLWAFSSAIADERPVALLTTNVADSLALSRDGHLLAVGDRSPAITVYQFPQLSVQVSLKKTEARGTCNVQFSHEGARLLSECLPVGMRPLEVWSLANPDRPRQVARGAATNDAEGFPYAAALSPVGNGLAGIQLLKNGRFVVETYTLESGKPQYRFDQPPDQNCRLRAVSFSPSGKELAATGIEPVSKEWRVIVWDVATAKVQRVLSGGLVTEPSGAMTRVLSVGFSKSGNRLAAGNANGHVRIWNTKDWRLESHIKLGGTIMAFLPDDETLVTQDAEASSNVILWAIPSGERRKTLRASIVAYITCLAVAPDGRAIVVGGYFERPSEAYLKCADGGGGVVEVLRTDET